MRPEVEARLQCIEFICAQKVFKAQYLFYLQNESTQNDVSYDDDVGVDPIVQYVVIPALPKAVLIEWQVVASLNCRHRIGMCVKCPKMNVNELEIYEM